ncbi:hypothetical protein A2U01_0109466, partial [Trifolium medium]|nr:hypothetical protein [Trifolium medium]
MSIMKTEVHHNTNSNGYSTKK